MYTRCSVREKLRESATRSRPRLLSFPSLAPCATFLFSPSICVNLVPARPSSQRAGRAGAASRRAYPRGTITEGQAERERGRARERERESLFSRLYSPRECRFSADSDDTRRCRLPDDVACWGLLPARSARDGTDGGAFGYPIAENRAIAIRLTSGPTRGPFDDVRVSRPIRHAGVVVFPACAEDWAADFPFLRVNAPRSPGTGFALLRGLL